jgi:hypothetical protein
MPATLGYGTNGIGEGIPEEKWSDEFPGRHVRKTPEYQIL